MGKGYEEMKAELLQDERIEHGAPGKRAVSVQLKLNTVWVTVLANVSDDRDELREKAIAELESMTNGTVDFGGSEIVDWEYDD